jgi:hypothetical protein
MDKALLYNTGADKVYSQDALNSLFNTKDEKYLQSNDVSVLHRVFGGLGSYKMAPSRALTDPPTPRPSLNGGVVNDMYKGSGMDLKTTLWKDGTYDDMKKMSDRAAAEYNPDLQFAQDKDFNLRFSRLEREKDVQSNIANYFAEKAAEREGQNRLLLSEYGLTPDEVDAAIAQRRVNSAVKALEQPSMRTLINPTKRLEDTLTRLVMKPKVETLVSTLDIDRRPTEKTEAQEETFMGATPRARNMGGRPIYARNANEISRLFRGEIVPKEPMDFEDPADIMRLNSRQLQQQLYLRGVNAPRKANKDVYSRLLLDTFKK